MLQVTFDELMTRDRKDLISQHNQQVKTFFTLLKITADVLVSWTMAMGGTFAWIRLILNSIFEKKKVLLPLMPNFHHPPIDQMIFFKLFTSLV